MTNNSSFPVVAIPVGNLKIRFPGDDIGLTGWNFIEPDQIYLRTRFI